MAEPAVVIVGAGPAGTCAAHAIARAGIRPIVVDEGLQSGGQIYRRHPPGFTRPAKTLYGFEAGKASRLHAEFDSLKKQIKYRPATLAWNIYENVLYTESDGITDQIPFDAAIVAPGATDLVLPFPGWSKAGVFTLGGAQVALRYQACSVGERTAFRRHRTASLPGRVSIRKSRSQSRRGHRYNAAFNQGWGKLGYAFWHNHLCQGSVFHGLVVVKRHPHISWRNTPCR